ncbi:hypothetical protein TraAM80_10424 [Trypanosoma rangeli]|uniref:Uncharacterized protein n=1 Tax=Trypanosoma rangeli TaxID=5698 RepID=A0A3R7M2P6_TRYRA|nr:uncharacterized protein TraAM80_10424 [Trypanosoma rangeli]RNE95049.1 hypothetical protein TraAM80_10424 [Trypanosoma rangeli]|eukprot:RNE95049.1 hypothetical protein TraAM80_10424 [Trypanosoma rangeli]
MPPLKPGKPAGDPALIRPVQFTSHPHDLGEGAEARRIRSAADPKLFSHQPDFSRSRSAPGLLTRIIYRAVRREKREKVGGVPVGCAQAFDSVAPSRFFVALSRSSALPMRGTRCYLRTRANGGELGRHARVPFPPTHPIRLALLLAADGCTSISGLTLPMLLRPLRHASLAKTRPPVRKHRARMLRAASKSNVHYTL